jgi:hypothetical protein
MHRGWIKLYRCLLDDPVWQCSTPQQKVILVTLLLMANHTERKWQWQGQPYICRPGQMITSLASIQEKCGQDISIKAIRTALKRFEKLGFLANQSTMQNRLITICHWERYQSAEILSSSVSGNQWANDGQPLGNQRAPNKNVKNEKKAETGDGSRPVPLSFEQQDIRQAQSATTRALSAFMEDK